MTRTQAKDWLEGFGFVAIIASLLNMLVVQDAEVAAFLYKSYEPTEELSDFEGFRLSRNLFQRFRHGDIAYFQFERGED